MSALPLLRTLFNYRAWANDELLQKMEGFDPEQHKDARHAAIRLMNHCHVVDQIFAAHLVGAKHGFLADNTQDTPTLQELRTAMAALDRWYLDYVAGLDQAQLAESIDFSFSNGAPGRMTREEMLMHIAMHGDYHRGQVGLLLTKNPINFSAAPFTGYLHKAEASDRRR